VVTNIVMLVRNRHRLTEQALNSLLRNTPREEFTLTLVDDASDDFRTRRTIELASSCANATLVRIEKSSHVLARAKNLGVFWSRQTFGAGEWLYLSDNDVWFSPGWLGRLTETAEINEGHGYKLFGGQVHPYHRPISQIQEDFWEHSMLDGPSWLMRWKTWRSVGELNPSGASGPCRGEDVDWCHALTAKGGRIGVIQPHVVVHTGLTQTDGADAPGRTDRERVRVNGVLYE
jgi:hypothetical protein